MVGAAVLATMLIFNKQLFPSKAVKLYMLRASSRRF